MNYERAWFRLKKYVSSKTSHGKNELKDKMEEIEIDEALYRDTASSGGDDRD